MYDPNDGRESGKPIPIQELKSGSIEMKLGYLYNFKLIKNGGIYYGGI